jgi:tetratricopeptide (TPR) repeat protein
VTIDKAGIFLQATVVVLALVAVLLVADQDNFVAQASAVPGSNEEKSSLQEKSQQTEIFPLFLFAVAGMMLFPVAADLITFLHGVTDDKTKIDALALGKHLWSNRASVFNEPLVSKYFKGITPSAQITRGISSNEIYNAQTLGFIYAEVLQSEEKYDDALTVLDQMIPDQLVAISIADIELITKKYDEAIETTEDIENEDDATAMLLVLRGIAFREKTLNDAAVECFKRALSRKDRSEGLLHRALFERAETYARMGKKAMAVKDLEKILVDEPQYPEVEEKLAAIKK